MADFNYDEYDSGGYGPSDAGPGLALRARRWVNLAGAACSVSLVLGLGFWGYKLAVRDVTGVPVMRAVAGAMRTAPADPGGAQALNQGLTVNAIAAVGTSAKPADQITLAPLAVTLQPADLPMAVQPATAAQTTGPTTGPTTTSATAPAQDNGLPAPALSISGSTTPDMSVADALATIVPSDPNAMRRSVRPQPRPLAAAASGLPTKVQAVSAQTPAAATEIDPVTIALGTRLAQLGPFESPELARAKFTELQVSFGELMTGKAMVIQPATSGGRTFYRLRAYGFANEDDARRFCAALQAQQSDCIPVAQR